MLKSPIIVAYDLQLLLLLNHTSQSNGPFIMATTHTSTPIHGDRSIQTQFDRLREWLQCQFLDIHRKMGELADNQNQLKAMLKRRSRKVRDIYNYKYTTEYVQQYLFQVQFEGEKIGQEDDDVHVATGTYNTHSTS